MFAENDKIVIRFYSGYKSEETPRALVVEGREYPIQQVLSRKRASDLHTGEMFELFRCKVAGKMITIKKRQSGECEVLPPADFSGLSPK